VPSRVLTKQFRRAQARARRGSLVATLLIVSVGSLSVWQLLRLGGDAEAVGQSYDAIQTVGQLTEALLTAESGQRGFLLTDHDAYLEGYSAGIEAIPGLIQQFHERLAPYLPAERQASLEAKLHLKVEEMARVIELYEVGHRVEALAAVQSNTGKVIMDELREILDTVRRAEAVRLATRQAELRRTSIAGIVSVISVGLIAILVIVLLLRGQTAATQNLLHAVNIIQRQEGYLEAMLSSVSAPLILLDLEGKIRFANAASLELFQASDERLVGQPLAAYVQFRGSLEGAREPTIFERATTERRVFRERRVGIETPSGPQVIGLTVRPVEAQDGSPIGCMLTLRDIDEEEATVEELHQQDRVRDLEVTLGRITSDTSSAKALLERCGEAIRQVSDAHTVQIWIFDASKPSAPWTPLYLAGERPFVGDMEPPPLVLEAFRSGVTHEDLANEPMGWAFPLSFDPAPLGVIEVRTNAPLHSRLVAELPRLSREIAIGYDRRRSAEKIARMSIEKDRFFATVSHELRGPLVPLSYAVNGLFDREDTSPDPMLAGLLKRQVGRLERLVEDLLDIQRLQRGSLSLRREELDLGTVIGESREAALPLLEAKGQELVVAVPSEVLPVSGDAGRLVQVVYNLLNNASRYSGANTKITLSARSLGDSIEVQVSDEGRGIAGENLERVFHMFERGTTEGNIEGLGIGLALVHQIVALHGGTVKATSGGVGAGSTFCITLPASTAREPSSSLGSMARSSASPTEPRPPMFDRCIVIDDDIDSAETLALTLQGFGLRAEVVNDPSGALEAISKLKPELVLLDLSLPGHDRFWLIEQLRGQFGSSIRVVAVTGHADAETRAEALAHGFDAFLVKPISREQLAAAASRSEV
jgi:PAS domain S-box-containing protein